MGSIFIRARVKILTRSSFLIPIRPIGTGEIAHLLIIIRVAVLSYWLRRAFDAREKLTARTERCRKGGHELHCKVESNKRHVMI